MKNILNLDFGLGVAKSTLALVFQIPDVGSQLQLFVGLKKRWLQNEESSELDKTCFLFSDSCKATFDFL